jgi:hypothetical protein
MIRTLLINNANVFHVPLTDVLAPTLVDDMIYINDYGVYLDTTTTASNKFTLEVVYSIPVTISRPVYVQLNEILFYADISTVTLTCTINLTAVPCAPVQKDLVRIDAFPHSLNTAYKLTITSFQPNYQIKLYDP